MRFVVHLHPSGTGTVAGTVEPAGAVPSPFEGWLDLLRLLEVGAEDASPAAAGELRAPTGAPETPAHDQGDTP